MKTLRLIYWLFSGFTLFGQSLFSFDYGVSYPDGIISGLEYESEFFDTRIEVNYIQDCIEISRFYFLSNNISLGSVSYSGILRDLNRENLHYISFEYPSEVIINKEGNIQNNMGVIFEIPDIQSGCSFFRNKNLSQLLFWKNLELTNAGFISLNQSVTLAEKQASPQSWYLTESLLRSPVHLNTMVSMIVGTKELFGGGQFHINSSQYDPPGFSILFLAGLTGRGIYLQNELRINSENFVTSDLNPSDHSFLIKGKLNFLKLPVSLDNSYHFFLMKQNLPWENRLWELYIESETKYEYSLWSFEGKVDISFFNSAKDSLLTAVNLAASVKKEIGYFYWGFEGEAGYDSIYCYSLALEGGYESSLIQLDLNSTIEITRSVTLTLSLKGKYTFEKINLISNFVLEDMGIYNCGRIKMKPYFFLGLELEGLLNQKKNGEANP